MRLFKLVTLLVLCFFVFACKSKKKPALSGDNLSTAKEFIEFFSPLTLPYQVADTTLQKKDKDSLLISGKVFSQFVPDSVWQKIYSKNTKLKIYALGRVESPGSGVYLFVKTVAADKKAVFILNFDDKQKFAASLTALRPDNNKATQQSVVMDKRYGITKTVAIKNADGSLSDGKDVYSLNSDTKTFVLVMTDALNDKVTELINPIDTLLRKHKWSADYTNGKMNMVSIRDGRRPDRLSFFIHFEKNKGECTGELKGEALLKSSNTAEYREEGDPCILKFIFNGSSVTLKEQEGCGSRRGLKCAFDGSFTKQKTVKKTSK